MATNFNLSWNDESLETNTSSNVDYIRLQSGSNRVRIVSAPSKIDIHWEETIDGSKKKIVCGGVKCPICKVGHIPQSRFQMKVIDRADNKVKILECGKQIISCIRNFATDLEYGDPTNYDIKIIKEGSGRDTKYTVSPSPKKEPISAEEQAMVDEVPTITELNAIKSPEEIMTMQLSCLSDSIADLAMDDNMIDDNDPDWDDL